MQHDNQQGAQRHSTWLIFLPALALIVAIFLLSHQQKPPTIGNDPELSSIAGHLVAFGLLGGALYLAFRSISGTRRIAALLAVALATGYGVVDEFHQSFVPGRHTDPWDLLTDLVGAAIVVATLVLATRWLTANETIELSTKPPRAADEPPINGE